MIETQLVAVLQNATAITSLVVDQIYPVVLPEDSPLPAITFQIVASNSQQMFDTGGLQRLRVQFDCWSKTYLQAAQVRQALVDTLDGYIDSNFNALALTKIDNFDHESLQFRATIEFYIFTDQA